MPARSLTHPRSRRSTATLSAVTGVALVVSVGQPAAGPTQDHGAPATARDVRAAGVAPIRAVSRVPSALDGGLDAASTFARQPHHLPPPPRARHQAAIRAPVLTALRSRTAIKRRRRGGAPAVGSRTVWDRLARCESSGNWSRSEGLYEGGLQFHPETWDAYKPRRYPDAAYQASRRQQILVAKRVAARQGWSAWPACARQLGLR